MNLILVKHKDSYQLYTRLAYQLAELPAGHKSMQVFCRPGNLNVIGANHNFELEAWSV
jgi:hypothetical protein